MNSNARSRFIRGRARGGGAYRPYFYFRRNGRIIPAGGEQAGRSRGRGALRGGRAAIFRTTALTTTTLLNDNNGTLAPLAVEDSAFLRPEHFVAPEGGLPVQSILVAAPSQCCGWHLYFPSEKFVDDCEILKRVRVVEAHFLSKPTIYDLEQIKTTCCFTLHAETVKADIELMAAWPNLLDDIKSQPQRTLSIFGVAMHCVVSTLAIEDALSKPSSSKAVYVGRSLRPRKIYARPVGFADPISILSVTSADLDALFTVRGVITSVGDVDMAASWIAYKCSRCQQEQALRQAGGYSSRPYCCKRGDCLAKKGFIEQRSSPFTRLRVSQTISLTENLLQSVSAIDIDQPPCIDIEMRHDLVDAAIPGHEFIITGILKRQSLNCDQEGHHRLDSENKTGKIYLRALSVMDAHRKCHNFTKRDMDAISMINSEPDTFKLLVHSLAPEVHGQEMMKAGVVLSLFGGAGSQLHDESEIHVLLIGDPGIGKSNILQVSSNIAVKSFSLYGKRTKTSVNRVASLVPERFKVWTESGALVSSSRGHCTIDDIDRFASQQETLLQVMQSKSVCLAFSNLFTTLETPTSIIATANPIRGHYDHAKLVMENIRVNPSLLNQFHLVFLALDKPNRDKDVLLTEHIKALHTGAKKSSTIAMRFAEKPKTNSSFIISIDSAPSENEENYDLSDRLKLTTTTAQELHLLPPILIKKFIAYARHHVKPLLNGEAAEMLKTFYIELRKQKNDGKNCVISTSHFENLIRLSQARAKVDFSSEVTKEHVRDAICLVRHSIDDTTVGNYVDIEPATSASTSQRGQIKKFIQMLQMRSNALGRRVFEFDELKDMARHAGISCGVTNLVEVVNMQGHLLKKGPNVYEVLTE